MTDIKSHCSESYKKPPVVEALIDIIVIPQSNCLEKLKGLADSLNEQFPTLAPIFFNSTRIVSPQQDRPGSVLNSSEMLGYKLTSTDNKLVLQIKSTGFTISRVGNYNCWDDFKNEAVFLWQKYIEQLHELNVIRIGVRYINKIDVSQFKIELQDYFNTYPKVANNRTVSNFFMQLQIPLGNDGRFAVINQSAAQPNDLNSTSIILDIDVFEGLSALANDPLIWKKIDELKIDERNFFDESLTKITKELFD